MSKILRVLIALGIVFISYFVIANYLSYRSVTKQTYATVKLFYKRFSPEIAVIKRAYTFVNRKKQALGIFRREHFVAVNGVVTVGFKLSNMQVGFSKRDSEKYVLKVTLPAPEVLTVSIKEVLDPTGALAAPEEYNAVIQAAIQNFKARALRPGNVLLAYSVVRRQLETVFREIFPAEHLRIEFIAPGVKFQGDKVIKINR